MDSNAKQYLAISLPVSVKLCVTCMSTVAFGLLNASKPWWALMIYMYLLVWGQILHPFVPVHDSVECSSFPRTYLFSHNFLLQECWQLMKNKNCILCSNSVAISYTKYNPESFAHNTKNSAVFILLDYILYQTFFIAHCVRELGITLKLFFQDVHFQAFWDTLSKITVTFFTLGFEHCQTSS